MKQLLQDWVSELTLQQQAVLVAAIRGCDWAEKEDKSKHLLRFYRYSILHNARPLTPENNFMVELAPTESVVKAFMTGLDHYPVHWLTHFAHAAEIVGYCHPVVTYRSYWLRIYLGIMNALHFNPESEEQMRYRLRF